MIVVTLKETIDIEFLAYSRHSIHGNNFLKANAGSCTFNIHENEGQPKGRKKYSDFMETTLDSVSEVLF